MATRSTMIYTAIMSLDGYVADEDGTFDWAAPDEEMHRFINDLERPICTYLYGRRMYDTMVVWESAETIIGRSPVVQDFAQIWRAADKIVYSTTLERVSSGRTRIERAFDPNAVRQLKERAERPISVGGPHLAALAIAAGLVDEYRFFIVPVAVGGGTSALSQHIRVSLDLLDERRFRNGVIYLHYRSMT